MQFSGSCIRIQPCITGGVSTTPVGPVFTGPLLLSNNNNSIPCPQKLAK